MYHAVVRWSLAIALLTLFSLSLIPPSAFASDPEAGLPACCRRAGKHHCSKVAEGFSSGLVLQASRCSFFPGARVVTASPKAGMLTTPLVSRLSHASTSAIPLANEAPSEVLFHSPRRQRGPPVLLLSEIPCLRRF
jgi:hypothetical protein